MARASILVVGILGLFGCAERPPKCTELTLDCQFAHYKYDTSRLPPVEHRASQIAKLPNAKSYVEAHRDELRDFAYQTVIDKIEKSEMDQQNLDD